MKRWLPLLLAASGIAAAQDEIPYGVEFLTGYRSEYVDRGFDLSQDLIEVQIGSEFALSNHWLLQFGGWYGTGTGSGDFEAAEAFLGIRYETETWDAGIDTSFTSYDHRIFRDAFTAGPFFNWYPHRDWRFGGIIEFDTGTDGWYGAVEAGWSQPTGRKSFVRAHAGASAVSGFYGRNGLNDLYARLAWTYGFNRTVAITPFVGTSIALDSAGSNQLYAGLWFEVNF